MLICGQVSFVKLGGGGERRDGGGEDRCGKKNIGDLTVDPIFLRIEIVFYYVVCSSNFNVKLIYKRVFKLLHSNILFYVVKYVKCTGKEWKFYHRNIEFRENRAV